MRATDIRRTGSSTAPAYDSVVLSFGLLAVVTVLGGPAIEIAGRQLLMSSGKAELTWAAVFATGYLRDAKSAIEAERDVVLTERDAFRRFIRTVESTTVSDGNRSDATIVTTVSGATGTRQLRRIRERFQETVMNVPHFEDEYDEDLRECLVAEFDERTATALLDGGQFSRPLKQRICYQATTAQHTREEVLKTLSSEFDSIETSQATLQTIKDELERGADTDTKSLEKSFHELSDRHRSLRQTEARCEQLLADRQRDIRRVNRSYSRSGDPFLQEYLYDDLDVRFPVLAAVSELIREIRPRRRSVLDAITRRS